MILTVTLNLALDVTYRVDQVRVAETSQVEVVGRRAGGKGVNVARVLHALGRETVITGLAGGDTGAQARAEIARSGIPDATVPVADASRTALMLVDSDGAATGFSEPGPEVSAAEWRAMLARFGELIGGAEVAVLSGRLPPGVPSHAYAELIGLARRADVPVLLDVGEEPLALGVAAGPQLVKINEAELAGFAPGVDVFGGASRLRDAGAREVVISRGEAGLVAVVDGGAWSAAPPEALRGNPTGAGDAASAALAVGLADGTDWPRRLADAAALSASAVAAPLAGSFDRELYRRLLGQVEVRELGSASRT
jgi:tagatose 6-phosphate kinase